MLARGVLPDPDRPTRNQLPAPLERQVTGTGSPSPELVRLAAWAQARLPRLADQIQAAVLASMDAYRDGVLVSPEDLRRSPSPTT